MYLFKNNNSDQIEVYELKPKENEIRDYKRKELDSIKEDKRFLMHIVSKSGRKLSRTNELEVCPHYDCHSDIEGLNHSDIFVKEETNSENELLRERFINGDLESYPMGKYYKIVGLGNKNRNTRNLYLFSSEPYMQEYKNSCMHGILVLTHKLYVLHLLESNNFELLCTEDVSDQLDLFDIEMVKTINWDNIRELSEYGLVNDACDNAQKIVSSTEDIVKLAKKNS